MSPFGAKHDVIVAICCWILFTLGVIAAVTPLYVKSDKAISLTVTTYFTRRCTVFANDPTTCVSDFRVCGTETDKAGAAFAFVLIAVLTLTVPMFISLVRLTPFSVHANSAVDSLVLYPLVAASLSFFIAWPITISIYAADSCGKSAPAADDYASMGASGILSFFAWLLTGALAKIESSEQESNVYLHNAKFADEMVDAWTEVRQQVQLRCPALCKCCDFSSANADASGQGNNASSSTSPGDLKTCSSTLTTSDTEGASGEGHQRIRYGAI